MTVQIDDCGFAQECVGLVAEKEKINNMAPK